MKHSIASIRLTVLGAIVGMLFCGLARRVSAQCETPEVTSVKVFCAQADILTDHSYRMTDELAVQGYSYSTGSDMYKDEDTSDNTTSPCTVGNLEGILKAGSNFWIHSHGGNVIECRAGQDETQDRYDTLVDLGYEPYIYMSTTSDPTRYVICLKHAGAAAWSVYKKQIIFLAGCSTSWWFADYNGGLELGYAGSATANDHEQNARVLFQNMSGKLNYGTKRISGDALALDGYTGNFEYGGTIPATIVLAPAVKDHFPGTNVCSTDCTGHVEFDCKMKNNTASNLIYETGCPVISNIRWNDGTTKYKVYFDLTDTPSSGTGTIGVDADYAQSANNSVELDGNQTDGVNGKAPNGDDFSWEVNCTQFACDPAFVQPDQRHPREAERLRLERRKRLRRI